MYLGEHLPQLVLERLVLLSLVELADEMAASAQCVTGERQGCGAKVLFWGERLR